MTSFQPAPLLNLVVRQTVAPGFRPVLDTPVNKEGEAMKRTVSRVIAVALSAGLLGVPSSRAQPPAPLEKYRNMKYRPTMENFDKGWKERVLVEFEIVNSADL